MSSKIRLLLPLEILLHLMQNSTAFFIFMYFHMLTNSALRSARPRDKLLKEAALEEASCRSFCFCCWMMVMLFQGLECSVTLTVSFREQIGGTDLDFGLRLSAAIPANRRAKGLC